MICLHHEHLTDSCFGKDQQRTICGLEGCKKRHHPSLHSAPQGTVQAVQVTSHLGVDKDGTGGSNPGVGVGKVTDIKTGSQGKFLSRQNEKKVQCRSWTAACWSGGTQTRIDEQRAKELQDMMELLKLPVVDGSNVLLLMRSITVKHGPAGELAQITVFWGDGSTCSHLD